MFLCRSPLEKIQRHNAAPPSYHLSSVADWCRVEDGEKIQKQVPKRGFAVLE
jgi:hypothetical protein